MGTACASGGGGGGSGGSGCAAEEAGSDATAARTAAKLAAFALLLLLLLLLLLELAGLGVSWLMMKLLTIAASLADPASTTETEADVEEEATEGG